MIISKLESIKKLLVKCLEMHYGNISDGVVIKNDAGLILQKIRELVND